MTSRTMIRGYIFAAAVGLSLSGSAAASELYAVNFNGPASLYSLNQTTGAISLVGASGVSDIGDLASNPATGTIWGIQIVSSTASTLYNFNPATGAAFNPVSINSVTGAPVSITSIAFDAVTGKLYGNTTPSYSGVSDDQLYQIDPTTGTATLIGTTIGFNNVYGLGFDTTGKLFGLSASSSALIGINTSTGTGASIGALASGTYFDLAARPEDNVMFLTNTFSGSPAYSLLTIDTGSAALSTVGAFGSDVNTVGLAFVASVPEPGSLALLGLALAGLGFSRRKLH